MEKRFLIQRSSSNKLTAQDSIALDDPFKKAKKRKFCIFYQDNSCKFYWDMTMTACLFFICLVIPVHMAFKSESVTWC